MELKEIAPRLWWWTAPHPDWKPKYAEGEGWGERVSSYALVADDALLLFDPLVPSDEPDRFWQALDGEVNAHGSPAIVITLYWHTRSAREIAERYEGSTVWAPARAAKQVERRAPYTDTYTAGDGELPAGIRAHDTGARGEMVLYLPSHNALLFGDVVLDGVRLLPDGWLPKRVTRDSVRESLRPLLDETIELLLLTHGGPVADGARAKLERVLEVRARPRARRGHRSGPRTS
jgi:glyoxylase-like metal-dependent hydrolase (beta-lactamase superfamily II)